MQEVLLPDESTEPNAAPDENESGRKLSACATAGSLRGVKDDPFKSIARSLCLVLGNCEV